MRCDTCQVDMTLVHEVGDHVKLRCPTCGRVWGGMAVSQDLMDALLSLPRYQAVIVWAAGHPSDRELIALRTVIPQFKHLVLGELRKLAAGSAELELDHYVAGDAADDLRRQASSAGLQIRLKPAPLR